MIKLNKKTIAKEALYYSNPFKQAIGLMFRFKVKRPIIFDLKKERIVSIHMFFVFCSIDVVFLDRNKKIVEMKKNLKPFQFYTSRKPAMYFIEAAEGFIENKKVRIGDIIAF